MAVDFLPDSARRNPFLARLLEEGSATSPIRSPWQGASRLAFALLAGLEKGEEDRKEQRERALKLEGQAAVANALLGQDFAGRESGGPPAGSVDAVTLNRAANVPVPPRAPVPSSAKVIGDEEAERMGIYEPRGATFNDRFNAAMPPAATPTQGGPSPQPASLPSLPPQSKIPDQIRTMLQSTNPYVRQFGLDLAAKLQNQQPKNLMPVDTAVATELRDPVTGRVVQTVPKQLEEAEAAKERGQLTTRMNIQKEATKAGDVRAGNIVVQDIDRGIKLIDTSKWPTTGLIGQMLSVVGGTDANQLAGLLSTIKANAGFQQLQAMRQASPTGGALGNVTEQEMRFLQAAIGDLEQSRGGAMLKDNLRRVRNLYLDVIHGVGNGPEREKLSFEEAPSANEGGPRILRRIR